MPSAPALKLTHLRLYPSGEFAGAHRSAISKEDELVTVDSERRAEGQGYTNNFFRSA
jgi:hypothetical protein